MAVAKWGVVKWDLVAKWEAERWDMADTTFNMVDMEAAKGLVDISVAAKGLEATLAADTMEVVADTLVAAVPSMGEATFTGILLTREVSTGAITTGGRPTEYLHVSPKIVRCYTYIVMNRRRAHNLLLFYRCFSVISRYQHTM